MRRLTGDERLALTALGAIVLVTAGWWALALWPVQAAPEWLSRTRAVCFGASPDGLPDGGGWILLVGQPLSMLGFLMIVWGGTVRQSLRALASRPVGRLVAGATVLAVAAGVVSAGIRVTRAVAGPAYAAVGPDAAVYPRLDREAAPLRLLDQTGQALDLAALRGRAVLLTFGYAHCETICPVIVQQSLAARDRVAADDAVVIVTLDPWRDTPARLPSIAEQWGIGADDYVLSGDIAEVLSVLEAWNVPITRHENTGLIDHPAVVYVIDEGGRVAFAATGGTDLIAGLLRRSRPGVSSSDQ